MSNKYITNYCLSIANTVAGLVLPIITFPYISRILGPEKIGLINFVQSYGYYFMHIASFGISSYAIREISRIRSDAQKVYELGNEIYNINILFSFLSGAAYLIVVLCASKFRSHFLLFALYSMTIFSNFLGLEWLFQSFEDYAFTTIRSFAVRILSLISVFVLIHAETDYPIYMIILCFSEMGARLSNLLYAKKRYINFRISYHFLNFSKHLRPLSTLFIFRMVNGISANLDKIMLGFFLSYYSVGIYSSGVRFVFIVIPLIETVGIVLFPKITISAKENKQRYLENLGLNYRIILLLAIPMAVGMFLVSPELIVLFAGEKFVSSVMVSRIMSITILLVPIADLLGSKTLLVHDKDTWLLICSTVVAASNIVLNLIGIPLWGVPGACIASVACYVITDAVRYFFTQKIINFKFFIPEFFKYALFTLPFILIYVLLHSKIKTSVLILFAYIFLAVLIYFLELVIFRDRTALLVLSKLMSQNFANREER